MLASAALKRTLAAASRPASANATLLKPLTSTRNLSSTGNRMTVHNLVNKDAYTEAVGQENLIVIDCFATWCGPCKIIAPQVVKFSESFPNASFYKIDVDEVPDVAQELGVRAMPTFLLFKKGQKVGEVVGANPNALKAAIEKNYE